MLVDTDGLFYLFAFWGRGKGEYSLSLTGCFTEFRAWGRGNYFSK